MKLHQGSLREQAVGLLVAGEPAEDGARAGERCAHGLGIGAIHPVVVEHADVEQREGGDGLRQGTGIAAARDAFGDARVVEGRERLAGETVVAGDGVGDEGLDAGVADVLELLVVGRVHVGLMGVEPGGAPGDLPDFGEVGGEGIGGWTGGGEGGALLKGIGGEVGGEGFEGERLVGGGDVDIEIAPGAPPERREGAMGAAVGKEAVGEAEGATGMLGAVGSGVGEGVAVGFVLLVVVERFGVGEDDFGAFSAGDGEGGVGGGEGSAVEEDVDVRIRREGQARSDAGNCARPDCAAPIMSMGTISPAPVGEYSMGGNSSGTRAQGLSPVESAEWA